MALYSDKVMDHFMNPRNVGEIAEADIDGIVGVFGQSGSCDVGLRLDLDYKFCLA